jgi:hypothetical protein
LCLLHGRTEEDADGIVLGAISSVCYY